MKLSRSARPVLIARVALVALVAGLTTASQVQALPPEYLANAAFHPTDPNVLVVRYESAGGGFLITRDGGKSFHAYPSYAFYDYGLVGRVPFLEAGDGKLLLGLSDAYLEDDGTGCAITKAQVDNLGQSWIADIAPHPSDPTLTFVANTGSASDAKHVGLWKRDKNGALTALGVSEPAVAMTNSVIVRGLKVVARAASMEGLRFVETITRQTFMAGQNVPTPSSALRYSDDLGATWTEHSIPDPDKTSGAARLLAVTSTEPMKILVSLDVSVGTSDEPDPLFYSTDGGESFTLYSKELLAISQALLLEGGKLLLADSGSPGGLYTADAIGMPLRKILDDSVKCLAQQPGSGKILMCKPYEVGFFDLASASFCRIFQINETVGLMACPSTDLSTNKKVKDQLCNAWCGPAHYSFSPLCAIFNDPSKVCGIQARAYDTMDPNPMNRWVEPPGSFASPRCPESSASDAGTEDAGTDVTEPHDRDDASTPDRPAKKDGCSVGFSPAHDSGGALFALSLLSLLTLRRRVSGARKTVRDDRR